MSHLMCNCRGITEFVREIKQDIGWMAGQIVGAERAATLALAWKHVNLSLFLEACKH